MNHVDIGRTQPASYKALIELHVASTKAAVEVGLSARLVELVKIRASQMNGCAYCLRMHTVDALRHGETTDRLAVLSAWRETTDYFAPDETSALEITEYVTHIGGAELSADAHARIRESLSAGQIAAVHWLAIVINAFNRVAISSHLPVTPAS
ncbi:carboxymuconolactone decarboxylase family protein [Mycolicibacterium sediminis]|uniref:Alkyl hydroperoxide reductase AhpD n=1 Tax=Mycolicibacterium sediminis TaxID=1286180 RepID=A0A7I7QWK2_9MYCO|nr:carboxymuconolactone decarboxylase family protein [Mycolicibacterium sediminis]BBY30367.1 alkyl hydroperoxide reductase AhpD [Mycolicibacterium sediminis]